MLDLLIKNGTVVDGTGAPSHRADVAIQGGKIAAIGKITEGATRVVNPRPQRIQMQVVHQCEKVDLFVTDHQAA